MITLNFHKVLYDVELVEPKIIKAKINETDTEYTYFTLNKECTNKLYKNIGVKFTQSKAIYEADHDYWKKFIYDEMLNNKFSFESYYYISAGEYFLSILESFINIDEIEKCYNNLQNELSEINEDNINQTFDLDNYKEKIVIYTKDYEDEAPYKDVVIIENDYINSKYNLISGIYINKMFWLHSAKSVGSNTLPDFLVCTRLNNEIGLSVKFGEAIYKDYKFDSMFLNNYLSINEVFNILKRAKINFELEKNKEDDNFGMAIKLTGIPEGSIIGDRILDSVNSFDMPVRPLMRLQALKKSFKDSEIPFENIMQLFTMEYLNNLINVSIDNLLSIKSTITKHANDSIIIQNEIEKLQK